MNRICFYGRNGSQKYGFNRCWNAVLSFCLHEPFVLWLFVSHGACVLSPRIFSSCALHNALPTDQGGIAWVCTELSCSLPLLRIINPIASHQINTHHSTNISSNSLNYNWGHVTEHQSCNGLKHPLRRFLGIDRYLILYIPKTQWNAISVSVYPVSPFMASPDPHRF